ncbi:uncharacterized protein EHS24_004947 [Apiotrichum porosum]|uniref:RNA polymerase II associated protein 1 n=1 Tax=Apiotrichum porosum TaxID=105984 RepID=A0A427Y6J1_9TREE|nr:uncharacterized protein EHS24_004947 [Apiotrichum porosum]RSH86676.1 hypothetical protein EHS24_004947 [Apiotrichum porosum]
MIVRDIVERPTANPSEPKSTPLPPRPPVAGTSKHGFPLAGHRSTRPAPTSAFARSRKDDATRASGGLATGEGRLVDTVPQVMAVADASQRAGVEAAARFASMTDKELNSEAAELKQQHHGLDSLDLLNKRRASLSDVGPARIAAPSETDKLRADVDAANREKLQHMSAADVAEEVQDLQDRFDPALLARLRARAAGRLQMTHGAPSAETASPITPAAVASTSSSELQHSLPHSSQSESEPEPHIKQRRRSVRFQDDDLTPNELRQKYFPHAPPDEAKLEWMNASANPTGASSSSDPNAPRFDLSGTVLTAEAAAALPTHLGLHHHGDQPDLAGYTTTEIVHLCYSTVASQRITMMGVLSKLIVRARAADEAKSQEPWVVSCREDDTMAKGIEVGSSVLGSHTRSVGVLVAAVDLLFNALGGYEWAWMDPEDAHAVPFRPEPMKDGEPTGVAAVPYDDIAPRLKETLGLDAGDLPPATLEQLLRVLQRGALNSPTGAETVATLVPTVVKAHVLRAAWPLDPARPPNSLALRLLHDVTASSRVAAEALVTTSVYEPLLKFVASDIPDDAQGRAIVLEVLRIFYTLGRYGLSASIATATREIWQHLGKWVTEQLANPTPNSAPIVSAYFDLLRVWTVCAVDPHRTTPEHDFTWAQASALQWVDEELTATQTLLATERWGELASVLSALVEYVVGVDINGVRHGEEEKRYVLDALTKMDIIGSLPGHVHLTPKHDEGRVSFNEFLTQIFRLHNLFRVSGMALLEYPERERYLWWFAATTQTKDVNLRCAFLETARLDNVLDVPKWATSVFDTIISCTQGDEPLALQLVDDVLRADWVAASVKGSEAIAGIDHKDGLQILRPLLHHSILPDLEGVLAPTRPSHLYLKASGTLRPLHAPTEAGPGLPLAPDWVFSPLDELLQSGSSPAFSLAPADWDATETQLTRATLALGLVDASVTSSTVPRSLTLLNCMKVFMLEHGQQDAPNAENDVFRDTAVSASIKQILDSQMGPSTFLPVSPHAPLESAALNFLGPGVPFFQFYTDLHALYESVSFGDNQFGRVLLPPLAMNYDVDYRRLFWSEQAGAIRSIRVKDNEVPLESGKVDVYFAPLETDEQVLTGQARALVGVLRQETHPFLYCLAVHHLAGLLWRTDDEERTSLRVQLLVVILSSAQDSTLKSIVQHDLDNPTATVGDDEVKARVDVITKLAGPRGAQRLAAAGF